jgi:hypothetical protein
MWPNGSRSRLTGNAYYFESICFKSLESTVTWTLLLIRHSGRCGSLLSEERERILEAVREQEIDREVLATLTEDEVATYFHLSLLGKRRKVMLRIKELCCAVQTPRQTELAPGTLGTNFPSESCPSFSRTSRSTEGGTLASGQPKPSTGGALTAQVPLGGLPAQVPLFALTYSLSGSEHAKVVHVKNFGALRGLFAAEYGDAVGLFSSVGQELKRSTDDATDLKTFLDSSINGVNLFVVAGNVDGKMAKHRFGLDDAWQPAAVKQTRKAMAAFLSTLHVITKHARKKVIIRTIVIRHPELSLACS